MSSVALPLAVRRPSVAVLSLAALGVVYGDIGTSPLYAFQTAFAAGSDVALTEANVLGVLSLFFWSLILVVTVKYVLYVMRASNGGEGGVMAIMALALRRASGRQRALVVACGLVGVALFYGDGVITPAISVLSAIEGTQVVTPRLHAFIVPITLLILAGLFIVQRRGTDRVGRMFGPVMIVWFLTLAVLGLRGIATHPAVLQAINPTNGAAFIGRQPWVAFVALGAVVLCITGTEALYADMGHFGRAPIGYAWIALVLPALLLNYFGQGALVLENPTSVDNPFYRLAPTSLTVPLVILSTVATIIASQAVISGAYSLTQQAIQLGYLPRMTIRHTSAAIRGQIYVPAVNWALFVAIVVLVLGFKTSVSLASAYGIAVTGTMVMTTVIAYVVARGTWGWKRWQAIAVTTPLLAVDLAFFGANALKIVHGGWFPLAFGGAILVAMTTWSRGRARVREIVHEEGVELDGFLAVIDHEPLSSRVPGTAVFLSAASDLVPRALLSNRKHNLLFHERTVLVSVETVDSPRLATSERVVVEHLAIGFWRITLRCGFLDVPDVPAALRLAGVEGLVVDPETVSYFVGRDTVVPGTGTRMSHWRQSMFSAMHWNAGSSADFFRLPADRVIEVGSQIVL
jgi:KUP system potassium uptake protein